MNRLTRPPSLRLFLDVGCDITTVEGWECLAELGLLAAPRDPGRRMEDASVLRELVDDWLTREQTWFDTRCRPIDQGTVTRIAWEAECLEEPELVDRFEAALPDDVRAQPRNDREVLELEATVYGPSVDPPVEWPPE